MSADKRALNTPLNQNTDVSILLLPTGNSMRSHNNVQGASDFGSMPNVYSGYQEISDAAVRAKFETAWKVALPPKDGLDNHEMIRAVHKGELKCIYLKGEEAMTSDANAGDVRGALSADWCRG